MQMQLKQSDFIKVQQFIDSESKKAKSSLPIVSELSSTELWIGECEIKYENECWVANHLSNRILFNSKRNAMYYAFLIAYKNTKLIPELLAIDNKLAISQSEIVRYKYCIKASRRDNFKVGLYHNKLSEAVARYKKAKNDMYNWMDCAKYIN